MGGSEKPASLRSMLSMSFLCFNLNFLTALLRCSWYTTTCTYSKYTYGYMITNTYITPKNSLGSVCNPFPTSPARPLVPCHQANADLLLVAMDLFAFSKILHELNWCEWNHAARPLFWLLSLTIIIFHVPVVCGYQQLTQQNFVQPNSFEWIKSLFPCIAKLGPQSPNISGVRSEAST